MTAVAAASYSRTVKYDMEIVDLMIFKASSLMLDRKQRGQLMATLDMLLRLKNHKGEYTETYKRSLNSCGFGRFYSRGCGMAYLHRPVRGALAQQFYHDLDCVNSLPVITVQFAEKKYGRDLKVMRDYIARRPYYYDMLVGDLALTDKKKEDGTTETAAEQAKRIVNAIANGSSLENATENANIKKVVKPATKFLRELKAEMSAFATVMSADAAYADLWDWTKKNKKTPASFCSKIIQSEEANVLIAIDGFLRSRSRVTASWIYDGLFVEKLEGETTLPADLIAECVAAVKAATGYDIALKVKPFESYPKLAEWVEEWRTMDPFEKMKSLILVDGSNTILPEFRVAHRFVGQCLEAVGDLSAYNTMILNSHLGTGKTTEAVKMMKARNADGSLKYPRILVISARKSFTRFITGDLEREGLGFVAYDAPRPFFTPLSQENRVVVQVESLWKLDTDFAAYDFVVVDESETVLNQFYSLNTHKDNIRANHMMFERAVRAAKFVLYADAFVSQRTLLNATHMREISKIVYILNTFCPYERKATELYMNKEVTKMVDGIEHIENKPVGVFPEFCRRIMSDLEAGKRLVVIWTSLRKAEAFADTFLKTTDYKWRLYSSKSNAAQNRELENVEESWSALNLIMMTTSITVGINYNPEDESKIYDKLYLYACAKSALPRDIAQCLMRCRRIRSNELMYTIDRLVTSWMPSGAAEIRAAFHERRTNNRTANPVINWTDSPKWVEDNFVENERECALKSYSYVSILEGYLLRSGYTLEHEEIAPREDEPTIGCDKFNPREVPLIDYYEAEAIRKAVTHGLADEMDRLSLRRYNIHRNLSPECRAAEDGEVAEQIWVDCYKSMDTERIFWNLVGEKHTPTARFAEREASGKFSEMVSKKVAKRVILDKVLAALGMTASAVGKSSFEITPDMVTAVAPLESDIYRAFSERGKSRRKGDLTASHVVDMFTMIFGDWSGMECAILERKVKRIPKSTKQMIVFTVEIPAQPLWEHISEPLKEETEETDKPYGIPTFWSPEGVHEAPAAENTRAAPMSAADFDEFYGIGKAPENTIELL